jgi:hypothetical protein
MWAGEIAMRAIEMTKGEIQRDPAIHLKGCTKFSTLLNNTKNKTYCVDCKSIPLPSVVVVLFGRGLVLPPFRPLTP